MITNIILFPSGGVACTDEHGQQVPEWQGHPFCEHLRTMRAAGVITDDTRVTARAVDLAAIENTVADWIGPEEKL